MTQELRLAPPPKPDLLPQALQFFEDYTFRSPNPEEERVLRSMGYDIFIPTEARTLTAIVNNNTDYFRRSQLDFLQTRFKLEEDEEYMPPSMVVGLRSEEPFLSKSFNDSQEQQLVMHMKESATLQGLVPDARNTMLPVAVLAQLAIIYPDITMQLLFPDKYARALDITAVAKITIRHPKDGAIIEEDKCIYVAEIGRSRPEFRLDIGQWPRGGSRTNLGSLSAIVFIDEIINPLSL